MTLLYFINCIFLTFGPSFILYKSKLSEYRNISICIWGGIGYLLTQIIKLIFLAIFLPISESEQYIDITQEILKGISNFIDIVGIYIILKYITGWGEIKIISIGLGWETAESLFIRLIPIWIGGRNLEFNWLYIQMGIEANINLLFYISFINIVWIYQRKKTNVFLKIFIFFLLFTFSSLPSLLNYLRLILDYWIVLLIYTITVFILSILSWKINKITSFISNKK